MKRFYLLLGAAFAASMIWTFALTAQSRCPDRIGFQENFPCWPNFHPPILDLGFYAFYDPPYNYTGNLGFQADLGSNSAYCQLIYMQTVPCANGGFWYDNTFYCDIPSPTGVLTAVNTGTKCYYKEGVLIKCGDFLVLQVTET